MQVVFAMSITLAVGLVQLLCGVARLGRIASFLSDSLLSGFMFAVAVHVLPSQFHAIFGLPFRARQGLFKIPFEFWDFFLQLHNTQWVPLVTSLVSMVVLVAVREGVNNNKRLFRRLPAPLPVELVLIIGATLVSKYVGFSDNFNVAVVGPIPKGFPTLDVSFVRLVPQVLGKAVVMAVTFFALSIATAKILAEKHSYYVDANRELVALGSANVVGPLLGAFCCSFSASRSMVQDEAGGKTQRLFLQCTLLPRYWRISKSDFDQPSLQINTKATYKRQVREVPGVKIFRFEAALYFGNVHNFRNCLETETGLYTKELKRAKNDGKDLSHEKLRCTV
ncbi:pendrin-like [Babylonia areolata]|uniref:pendrin-like n=1 Tax=Babylonia areolata TaxID=304850 RepID=UPI003FD10F3D